MLIWAPSRYVENFYGRLLRIFTWLQQLCHSLCSLSEQAHTTVVKAINRSLDFFGRGSGSNTTSATCLTTYSQIYLYRVCRLCHSKELGAETAVSSQYMCDVVILEHWVMTHLLERHMLLECPALADVRDKLSPLVADCSGVMACVAQG